MNVTINQNDIIKGWNKCKTELSAQGLTSFRIPVDTPITVPSAEEFELKANIVKYDEGRKELRSDYFKVLINDNPRFIRCELFRWFLDSVSYNEVIKSCSVLTRQLLTECNSSEDRLALLLGKTIVCKEQGDTPAFNNAYSYRNDPKNPNNKIKFEFTIPNLYFVEK